MHDDDIIVPLWKCDSGWVAVQGNRIVRLLWMAILDPACLGIVAENVGTEGINDAQVSFTVLGVQEYVVVITCEKSIRGTTLDAQVEHLAKVISLSRTMPRSNVSSQYYVKLLVNGI